MDTVIHLYMVYVENGYISNNLKISRRKCREIFEHNGDVVTQQALEGTLLKFAVSI